VDDLIITNGRIVDGTGRPAFSGDVVVNEGFITEVNTGGAGRARARRTLDAAGCLVTPGFVDIHTHFDGQACWDKQLTPSCWHGVTTAVMGNCGVGFAPVRPGKENQLVELMESVEDIPGTALHEGITWGWETFGEYLDAIDTAYAMDIGVQVGHVPVRHYVMGERSYDPATADDISAIAAIVGDALACGALGFTTSRFFGHLDKAGREIPGTRAAADEIVAIAEAIATFGHGAIEFVSDHLDDPEELGWIEYVARLTGRTVTALVVRDAKEGIWELAQRLNGEGLCVRPQVGARPTSVLMSLESTVNPMRQFPSYSAIKDLSYDKQRRRLLDPEFRRRVLEDEAKRSRYTDTNRFISTWDEMFVLPTDMSYEPSYADSIAGMAAARGIHVREALMDVMASTRPLMFMTGGYQGNLDKQVAFLQRPNSLFGLSDAGAHCGVLCDASMPTYLLAYMTRDRRRGPTIPVELAVHKMTQDTASVYGLRDRGVVAPAYRADLNIVDYDALALTAPEMVRDLPAGGRRVIQRAEGYIATVCRGEVTYELGEHTGAMPGHLVRGGIPSASPS
jgi:N-acyl-D-aspartate/D-glutamate deacylase